MANYSDKEWEEIAKRWRVAAGLGEQIAIDAPSFVSWLKRNGYIKDYIRAPAEDLPTCDAKYEPDEGKIYYRADCWSRAEAGSRHDIWTIMHEACHVILNHSETRLRANNTRHASHRVRRDETDTDRLTAAMLAPFDKASFRPGVTPQEIADKFRISLPAAKNRVVEFERLYRQINGIPRQLPPGIVDFLQAQKKKGHRVTSLDNIPVVPDLSVKRYEGDPCPCCGNFRLVRTGTSMQCDFCSALTGDE